MEYGRNNTLQVGKKDFENIKELGVEVIRLPVWFEVWNDGAPDYRVIDECWRHLDDAVEWCRQLGMYLIIDFHNDCGGSSKTNPKIEKVLLKIWPQIAERYKDKGDHIIYEIMNEPHFKSGNIEADIKKWGKIQGNVLKAIREIDKVHSVIVGGENWNSIDGMLKLPDYKDDKLIYNFHDYSPFLFTHQGASWTYLKNITGIPFPYVKEKMPPVPKNADNSVKWAMKNYEKDSSKETLVAPLDKAVRFANERNAALMCNEFGVIMNNTDPQERVNWYRLKNTWMDERNIIRLSWDYTGSIGIFNRPSELRFPEDLNKPLLDVMGYKLPAAKSKSWLKASEESGNYSIYENVLADFLRVSCSAFGKKDCVEEIEKETNETMLVMKDLSPHEACNFIFGGLCDFSELLASDARIEFFIKTKDSDLLLSVYFKDSEKAGFPWRALARVKAKEIGADGKWHKISIPFKTLGDLGGWSNKEGWKNGEGKFNWTSIESLVFQNNEKASKEGFYLKNIRIVK